MRGYDHIFAWLSVIIAICFLIMFYTDAHAEGPKTPHPPHKKKLPPNCMIVGGQLRCWVIDPLPTEWPPNE